MSEPNIDLHVTVTFDRPLTRDELQAFTDTIEVTIGNLHEAVKKITVAGDYSVDGKIELPWSRSQAKPPDATPRGV